MNTQLISKSVATQDNKNTVEFNDWMFQHHDSTAVTAPVLPMIQKGAKDLFDSDASSSSTWFEPLESILSSTTSSSTGSPTATTTISSNDDGVKLEPMDDSFEFTLNKLLTQEKLKQEFEDDADAEDAILSPKRSNSIVSKRRLTENQKQAHNRIEKRYRININTKIAKLQQIIPWLATEQTAFASTLPTESSKETEMTTPPTTKKTRLNKSMILEKAVDYILYLQNNERLYEMEVMRLKSELNQYKN